ncbi:MAG: Ldh family oxidoreductase [Ruminococcaceae bacterium]|nr:Ldh family oxidoreductase [Oscillospiraceae bacterium]
MVYMKREALTAFCFEALKRAGASEQDAKVTAETLTETEAWGTHSHGVKNLYNYIMKCEQGGASLTARPTIIRESVSTAVIDANACLGMVSSCEGMELAIQKAKTTGIAMVTVVNSTHFGAAGYYANLAARQGLIGIAMSNVDANMTLPGARCTAIGNSPLAYAVPSNKVPSIFLDIAMSNVAGLKVVKAKNAGTKIPFTWIIDENGRPTDDPSKYPKQGALLPLAMHKGYGLAVMVEVLTGIIAGAPNSATGEIPSWCYDLDKPNKVSHTFIAINPEMFMGDGSIADETEAYASRLRSLPRADDCDRIYTPGEMEWEHYAKAEENGIPIPDDVEAELRKLADKFDLVLPVLEP